jgi:hypothetical protein
VNRWFNVNAGFERDPQQQPASNLRTLSSRFRGIRADVPNNWDLLLIKNTQMTGRTKLQFRAEAINFMNHPQFTAPNTTPSSTALGNRHRRVCLAVLVRRCCSEHSAGNLQRSVAGIDAATSAGSPRLAVRGVTLDQD